MPHGSGAVEVTARSGSPHLDGMPTPRNEGVGAKRVWFLAFAGAVFFLVSVLKGGLVDNHPAAPPAAATLIAQARDRHHVITLEDAEDDALPGAEADAGELWAKTHHVQSPDECPAYSANFREGCAGVIEGARK